MGKTNVRLRREFRRLKMKMSSPRKMFKSPIKVSRKNVGKMGRPDVIKAACKFLAERSSASAPTTSNRREADDQYDMYERIWAEKITQLDDLMREYVV